MSENREGDRPAGEFLDRDPVVEAYKKDIDRTLLRENLRLSPEERLRRLIAFLRFSAELRRAGRGVA